jgi:hypothetical protein
MNVPKVFVGTLHCGEGDFELCCEMIASQSGVVIEHHVISNLPELEAHNALWNAWNQRKKDFQLFVKVDADTVLKHNEVLFSFWKMIQENPKITGIQAPLHDYFTDSFINGLNCFTPEVEFKRSRDSLYCDRNVDVNHRLVIKADGVSAALRPAGLHCHSATEIQSFN